METETANSGRGRTPAVWLVGNSQLITSMISAYCTPEAQTQCFKDWQGVGVSQGEFCSDGAVFSYLSCNMGTQGTPTFVNGSLLNSQNQMNIARKIDSDATTLVLMLRGNEFAFASLVDAPPRWDFSYGASEAWPERQYIRTRDAVAYFEHMMNSLLATGVLFRQTFPSARIYHVAAPAPIESQEHILANPEVFASLFSEHGVRSFALRRKIYDVMYQPLAEKLAGLGIETIFTPNEALTESGGLRVEYAHGCLHGNAQYGRVLMAEFKRKGVYAPV
jgi:hypothetical protein